MRTRTKREEVMASTMSGRSGLTAGLLLAAWLAAGDRAAAQPTQQINAQGKQERARLEKQAAGLSQQAIMQYRKGRFAEAVKSQKQAVVLYRSLYPQAKYSSGHPALATGLNNLGSILRARGDYAGAERYFREALAMDRTLYPKAKYPQGHPKLATSLNNFGALLEARGDYEQAERFCREALGMYRTLYPKRRYPEGHPQLANGLNSLAMLLQERGDYGGAERYYRDALAMNRALYPQPTYPMGHPRLALTLNNLGGLLGARGDYGGAERYYRDALAMRRMLYPKAKYPQGHPDLATSLNNLGAVLQDRGDFDRAERYYQDALAMWRTLYPQAQYPAGHPALATSLNNLGFLLRARGDYGRAERYYQDAQAMLRMLYPQAKYPAGHPYLATSLDNLGTLQESRKDYPRAERYYRDALAMRRKLYPKAKYPAGHPELAYSLNNLGAILLARGDYDRAERSYQDALAMRRKLYPPAQYPAGHPDLAASLTNLGGLLHARGDYARAEPYLREALTIYQTLGGILAETAAEAAALNFLASMPGARDAYLAVTAGHPSTSSAGTYPPLWGGKGLVLRVLEGRQRLLRGITDKKTRQKTVELLGVRQQMTRLLYGSTIDHSRAHTLKLRQLTDRKEQMERELAEKVPDLARRQSRQVASPADLAKALPPRSAFVDFYRYRTWDFKRRRWDKAFYAAFILCPDRAVRRAELGQAAPIEAALAAWRKDIAEGLSSVAAERLRHRLWEPLEKQLPAGTDTIYLCPEGPLSRLPWAALPGSRKGSVLLEDYALALVPHGPFLLDQLRAPHKTPGAGLLLALGGVAYDRDPDPLHQPKDQRPAPRPDRGGQSGPWRELPGSARELDEVVALAKGLARPPQMRVLRGTAAGTAQVMAGLPQARWAHLATHGFFAAPDSGVRTHLLREADFLRGVRSERVGAAARNPLTQTGLVLAGANRPHKEESDHGILTAESVVGLDLSGLDLAVLSACETGLGEAQAGEGVFGLQRAFHLAGTKNVVASLWRVDDQATAALMGVFYHQVWVEKHPPLQALRRAQLALFRHPQETAVLAKGRGPDFDKAVRRVTRGKAQAKRQRAGRAPVKHWAGFVLSGAGR
jgi:CHAT domain-containing protein/Tfp pilus assembly protein PilF